MADLANLLRQWRYAESLALAAEKEVENAYVNMAVGWSDGPSDQMTARAFELRRQATDAYAMVLAAINGTA